MATVAERLIMTRFAVSLPPAPVFPESSFALLQDFLQDRRRVAVITGAGCSTESGIPDYRSPNGAYSKGHKPVTYNEFTRSPATRQRYWARSMTGWNVFSNVAPNATHFGIAALQATGLVKSVITQNVDRLHQKAGSQNVIELHGSQFSVSCLACKTSLSREEMQEHLSHHNPQWVALTTSTETKNDPFTTRPDGDVEVNTENPDYSSFNVPPCSVCGGILKPDVVFFGENVPKTTVDAAMTAVTHADGIVTAGTSLQVYSVFRFVKAARDHGIDVAIVNVGPTRGDELALINVQALTSTVFSRLARHFNPNRT